MASYLTSAEAQTYFNNKLHAEPWDTAVAASKTKALAEATAIIDRLNFMGDKTDVAQTNQFPRDADTTVPQDIKDATAEIALSLLDGVDPAIEYENTSMITQSYGNLKSTYNRTINQEYKLAGVPSITAWRILQPYLRDALNVDLNRVS